ncbi:MAG: alanine/glycine:cation symporter family protein [bacterium]
MKLEWYHDLIRVVSNIVWGTPTLILLFGAGLVFTIRLGFIQLRKFGLASKFLFLGTKKKTKHLSGYPGDISPFQALMVALAGAIGNGNIAGVATALTLGGPGAIFWMWLSALLGMATMYAESVLGIKYRIKLKDGSMASGPMYYIRDGLGWRWLAGIFAFFMGIKALFSTTMVQSNSISLVISKHTDLPMFAVATGLAAITWIVIVGGIPRIGQIAQGLTPFMSAIYVGSGFLILIIFMDKIPNAIGLILAHAFSPMAAAGGFAGASIQAAMRYGVARGAYSNEAGTGSAPVAHGAAKTKNPVPQGLIAMLGVFVDTLVICTMTALVILVTDVWQSGQTSTALTSEAFSSAFPGIGGWIVLLSSLFFGYSSLISWPYYGEQCFSYLFGIRIKMPYRWAFCLMILIGGITRVEFVWNIGDILNGMMAIPNLIAILALSGVVIKLTKEELTK